jgi:archaellum biogenesis ATPase FlaH
MGAGKWRESYSQALIGKHVVILPDADEPGEKHGAQVAHLLEGKAVETLRLGLPEGCKDLSEWVEAGSTAPAFHSLLNNAQPFVFVSTPKTGPLHESHFHPVAASVLLAEPLEEIEWILDEYLPAGGLVLLAGKPKEGKTTLSYELALNVAQGSTFLGRQTRKGAVLILALEEHKRDVLIRLRNLGATTTLENLYVHADPLQPTPTVLAEMTSFAKEHEVKLILVDTLAAFWRIENENDAAELTKVVKPLLQLARESGACVLLVHHARKAEGQYGDEIRGSGALFAAVDVALVMKRHEVQTQRLLQAQSRYPETPSNLLLELREHGYVALGDPASVGKAARLTTLTASLSDQWEEADAIGKRAGLSRREWHRLLNQLVAVGTALREGKGRKGSPYRFKRNSIHAGGQSIGHETNSTKADSIHATPPSPCTKGNPSCETEEVIDCDA